MARSKGEKSPGVVLTGPTGLSVSALMDSHDLDQIRFQVIFWGTLAKFCTKFYNPRFKSDFKYFWKGIVRLFDGCDRIIMVVDEFFAASGEDLSHLVKFLGYVVIHLNRKIHLVVSGDPLQLPLPDFSKMMPQISALNHVTQATLETDFIITAPAAPHLPFLQILVSFFPHCLILRADYAIDSDGVSDRSKFERNYCM